MQLHVLAKARQLLQAHKLATPAILPTTSFLPRQLAIRSTQHTTFVRHRVDARKRSRADFRQMIKLKVGMWTHKSFDYDKDKQRGDKSEALLVPLDQEYAEESKDAAEPWQRDALDRIKYFKGPPDAAGRPRDYYYQNLYKRHVDFEQLAKKDAYMKNRMQNDGKYIELGNAENVVILTKALLMHHFGGLRIDLPPNRLCPPIPNRHMYILWLKELLDSTGPGVDEKSMATTQRELTGLDIGTGASAIYPILGCTQRRWKFIATELDEESHRYAKQNIHRNRLEHRILLVKRDRPYHEPNSNLIPLDEFGIDRIDFCMTNPPFYESQEDMWTRYDDKRLPPQSVNTGAPVEMICKDGEVGFVKQMINESLILRDRVQWYTAMLSRPKSVEDLLIHLDVKGVTNVACTTLAPGSATSTRRWALAWSFGTHRPSIDAARGDRDQRVVTSKISKSLYGPVTEKTCPLDPDIKFTELEEQVKQCMAGLKLDHWEWDSETLTGTLFGNTASWTRAQRRKARGAAGGADKTIAEQIGPVEKSSGSKETEPLEEHKHEPPAKKQKETTRPNLAKKAVRDAWEGAKFVMPDTIPELEKALEEAQSTEAPKPTGRMEALRETYTRNNDDKLYSENELRRYENQYNILAAKQMQERRANARRIEKRLAYLRAAQGIVHPANPKNYPEPVLVDPESENIKDRYVHGFKVEIQPTILNIVYPGGRDEGKNIKTRKILAPQLAMRWLKGTDPTIFESFAGSIIRSLSKHDHPSAEHIRVARGRLARKHIEPIMDRSYKKGTVPVRYLYKDGERAFFSPGDKTYSAAVNERLFELGIRAYNKGIEFDRDTFRETAEGMADGAKYNYVDYERIRLDQLRSQKVWLKNREKDFKKGHIPAHRPLLRADDPLLSANPKKRRLPLYEAPDFAGSARKRQSVPEQPSTETVQADGSTVWTLGGGLGRSKSFMSPGNSEINTFNVAPRRSSSESGRGRRRSRSPVGRSRSESPPRHDRKDRFLKSLYRRKKVSSPPMTLEERTRVEDFEEKFKARV